MASRDYCSCGVCGGKTFYDGDIDYKFNAAKDMLLPAGCGDIAALCQDCSKKYFISILPKIDKEQKHD